MSVCIRVKKEFQNSETQKQIESILTQAGEIQITYQFDKRPIHFVRVFLDKAKETLLVNLFKPMADAGKLIIE